MIKCDIISKWAKNKNTENKRKNKVKGKWTYNLVLVDKIKIK